MVLTQHRVVHSLKALLTFVLACLGAAVLWHLYNYYTYTPQTRDGNIGADVVALAADVSGPVTAVYVKNDQAVQRGQVLFVVDPERLANALDRANANVDMAQVQLAAAEREEQRYLNLGGAVSAQDVDTHRSAAEESSAAYRQVLADRDLARINLERSEVRAPVNGIITNFSLRPGDYATAGQPLVSIVDSDSFYVVGYFEETKLPRIHLGEQATISVMGDDRLIEGHVISIAAGINDAHSSTTPGTLLANVDPTFSWVRLAQRVPVRVTIDHVPDGLKLIAGRTVTVTLAGADNALDLWRWP
jgi:RND family efflux transporter MFP subunit